VMLKEVVKRLKHRNGVIYIEKCREGKSVGMKYESVGMKYEADKNEKSIKSNYAVFMTLIKL
jgi:hypothetical protein